MKIKIEAIKSVEDGLHQGVILSVNYVERGEKKYKYVDLTLSFEEGKLINVGYSQSLNKESNLGKLLARFGTDMSMVGTEIDIDSTLIHKTCSFMTLMKASKKNPDKSYPTVIPESVKPPK